MRFEPMTSKAEAAQALFAASDSCPLKSGWGHHVTAQLTHALAEADPADLVRQPTDVLRGEASSHARVAALASVVDYPLAPPIYLNGRPAAFPATVGPRGVSEPFCIYELIAGTFVSVGGMPLLFNHDRNLISDVSSEYWPLAYFYEHDKDRLFRNAVRIRGETLVLADDIWEVNFCHWLVDTLPRLALLGPRRFSPDFNLVVGPYTAAFQAESLAALGIDQKRIFVSSESTAFQCDRMWVPSNLGRIYHPAFKASGWAMDFLRSAFPRPSAGSSGRRVYLSRGDASRRKVINEPELILALRRHGFVAIELARLPFLEQATALSDANMVIGLHGAGLSHVVFMPSGGAVVEIFPSSYGTMSFYPLTVARGNSYYTYNESTVVSSERSQCDDILLDVPRFMACLETIL